MSQKIPAVDAAFLLLESHDTPMHVAGLQIFSLPSGASANYLRDLVAELKAPRQLAAPWNLRLSRSALAHVAPSWETDHDVDLDYHVRHLALPQPGGERELGVLVSRLHSHRLDRRRPLWECHLIEGLEGNRFALFTKMHHALVDGVTTVRLLMQALADHPDAPITPPWAAQARAQIVAPITTTKTLRQRIGDTASAARGLGRLLRKSGRGTTDLVAPYAAPNCTLNGRVTGQRRLATQHFEIARIKRLARAADVTLNDVVLALCSAALRRFLIDANTLPDKPLVAAIPVSMRPPGDANEGNAVSLMLARIGTEIADPRARLSAIRTATRRAKDHLRTMTPEAQTTYSSLFATPFLVQTLTGLTGRTRPFFNVTVSNVPGPQETRYLSGARLEAMYPVSIAAHGQALNITCTSYAGSLNFGLVGCRDALPHLQRLAVYMAEAMAELEAALGLAAEARRPAPRHGRAAA
jgi:WS/DGAT/MGAT family acyltransferase